MHSLPGSSDKLKQLKLPFESVPEKVKSHGLRDAHSSPLVSRGKDRDGKLSSFRVSPKEAWGYPEIELRAANSYTSIIADLDSQEALQELYRMVLYESFPEYNWMVQRVVNGHSHAVWNLALPVHRGESAREAPLKVLARIAEYYRLALKADSGYVGVLTHNPMSRAHGPGFKTDWLRKDPYTLGELARVIPFGWRRPKVSCTDIGRNCDLFRSLARWAGSPANLESEPEITHFAVGQGQELSDADHSFLEEAVKWSVLFEEKQTKQKQEYDPEGLDYVLNPIYAPYFHISYRKRRCLTLRSDDLATLNQW